jgi:hypothetical protein
MYMYYTYFRYYTVSLNFLKRYSLHIAPSGEEGTSGEQTKETCIGTSAPHLGRDVLHTKMLSAPLAVLEHGRGHHAVA